MKKSLLFTLFCFLCITLSAQLGQSGFATTNDQGNKEIVKEKVTIFPNPASNYIGLTDKDDDVKQILVYNVVGRKMKTFPVSKGEKYYIADLPRGMYLIQLVGSNSKVITTQRLSKR